MSLNDSSKTIYFYAPSNAPTLAFTPELMYTRGLGGAEQSLVLLTRELASRGHRVYVFNNSKTENAVYDGVRYFHKHHFPLFAQSPGGEIPHDFPEPDVLVLYRAPSEYITQWTRMLWRNTSLIGWSCDQATEGNYFSWLSSMDKVVTISEFHTAFFSGTYFADLGITHHIDLPIAARDYEVYNDKPREPLFLWSSQHERGLARVALAWPLIRDAIPDSKLIITADHRLWGVNWTEVYERHQRGYRAMFVEGEGVEFLASIPRSELVAYQKRARIQVSPLTYEELFCVSVMEAQAAGAIPVVGGLGALPTTVMVGECVPGNIELEDPLDEWIQKVIEWAKRPDLPELSKRAHDAAMKRCAPSVIATQWENLFEACERERKERDGRINN